MKGGTKNQTKMKKLKAILHVMGFMVLFSMSANATVVQVPGSRTSSNPNPGGYQIVNCDPSPQSVCCIIVIKDKMNSPQPNPGTVTYPDTKERFTFDDVKSEDKGRTTVLTFKNMKPLN